MSKLNPSSRNTPTFVRLATAVTLLVAGCSGDNGSYRKEIVETCKGEKITVGEMETQLKAANYPYRLGRNIPEELRAYDNAACGPFVATCKGAKRWRQVDEALREAGFTGPLDHSAVELGVYDKTSCSERGR